MTTATYKSTRGQAPTLTFEEVLMTGLAADGGLYVPETWPRWSKPELRRLRGVSYSVLATEILRPFVAIPTPVLRVLIEDSYQEFRHPAIVPLTQINERLWIMELFHGPTLSFKDLALQLVGQLFRYLTGSSGKRYALLTATSGDTGSAAISGFQACQTMDVFVLYPEGRISEVQRRQMTTVRASNIHPIALQGTFDDCQAIVKTLFHQPELQAEAALIAANSINWGRIMSQTVYYFAAGLALGAPDRPLRFVVPTGNFGNIYAAYAAKQMGLPIAELVIATNENDNLVGFFSSGYWGNRPVTATNSPSIDIGLPSNLERYLFDLYRQDSEVVSDLIEKLKQGSATLPLARLKQAQKTFKAFMVNQRMTVDQIRRTYSNAGYLLDPHTAVGMAAAERLLESNPDPEPPTIVAGCAHPAKFPKTVSQASGQTPTLPLPSLRDLTEHTLSLPNETDAVLKTILRILRK